MKSYSKVILPMLIWGTLPIFVSKIPLSSAEIVMWRIIFGFAFLALIFLFTKNKAEKEVYKKLSPRLIFTGMLMGANWVVLFEAYRCVDVSVATLVYYMAPVFVMAASVFLFKEKAGLIKILGMSAALIGMFIVTGVNMGGADPARGMMLSLASAILYASVTLMNKITKGLSGLEMTIIQLIGAALVVIPYTVVTHQGPWLNIASEAGIFTIIIGLVHTGIALYLYFSAIQELPAQSVALCSYIDPASALFFAAIFLGDVLSPFQIFGALLILGGAAIGEILGNNREKVLKE